MELRPPRYVYVLSEICDVGCAVVRDFVDVVFTEKEAEAWSAKGATYEYEEFEIPERGDA